MHSVALLRAVAAHLFLVVSTVCAQTDKYIPPEQTAWQLELFKNVSTEAAARSAEARPELLAELDEKAFREQLAECCPSLIGLSASELLDRLVEDTAFLEVASGFASISSPQNELMTGMTVDDGVNGSYFQNMWQRRLLHNESFMRSTTVYGFANKTDAKGDESHLTLWLWTPFGPGVKGCGEGTFPPTQIATVVGKCIEIPQAGKIVGVHRENSSANLSVALYASSSEHMMSSLGPRHMSTRSVLEGLAQADSSSESEVPCPHKDPETVFTLPVTDKCMEIEFIDRSFFRFEDSAETSLYGLKPFTSTGSPKDLSEASERGCYSLANIYRLDAGSPLFGDVTAIFSSKLMLKSALVSGVDTGFVSSSCKQQSRRMPMPVPHNCSAYQRFTGLGTMEHVNHVLLQNHQFWQQTDAPGGLLRHLARMEGPWGATNITNLDLLTYFEVAPAANFLYPSGIRFLIATFNSLFGTAVGDKLRTWASKNGWVLLWSLGLNSDVPVSWMTIVGRPGSVDAKANQRIIDPSVANKTTARKDLPLDAGTCEAFEKRWVAARRLRALRPWAGNETWLAQWKQLRHQMPEELQVSPARARAGCPKPGPGVPECVGITASGKCVCYELTEEEQRQAQKQEEEVEAEERVAEPLIVA